MTQHLKNLTQLLSKLLIYTILTTLCILYITLILTWLTVIIICIYEEIRLII